jgi:hypothetical protein
MGIIGGYFFGSSLLLLMNRKWDWVYDNPVTGFMNEFVLGTNWRNDANEMGNNPGLVLSLFLFGPIVIIIILFAVLAFICVAIAYALIVALPSRFINWIIKKV